MAQTACVNVIVGCFEGYAVLLQIMHDLSPQLPPTTYAPAIIFDLHT